MVKREAQPLAELHGELVGIVVLPYLGAAAARREQQQPAPEPTGAALEALLGAGGAGEDGLAGLPMRLTYRTMRVLEGVARHAGASNRQVADHAGIADQGQVSKLLARLQRAGLLVNGSAGHSKGEPNAWSLTPKGETVARGIRVHEPGERAAA